MQNFKSARDFPWLISSLNAPSSQWPLNEFSYELLKCIAVAEWFLKIPKAFLYLQSGRVTKDPRATECLPPLSGPEDIVSLIQYQAKDAFEVAEEEEKSNTEQPRTATSWSRLSRDSLHREVRYDEISHNILRQEDDTIRGNSVRAANKELKDGTKLLKEGRLACLVSISSENVTELSCAKDKEKLTISSNNTAVCCGSSNMDTDEIPDNNHGEVLTVDSLLKDLVAQLKTEWFLKISKAFLYLQSGRVTKDPRATECLPPLSGPEDSTQGKQYAPYLDIQKSKIHEEFICFLSATDLTGAALSHQIVQELNRVGIQVETLRGQDYDGGANMSGNFSSIQFLVKQLQPLETYILVSDNGPPFNSAECRAFCQSNGIKPIKTPPYHAMAKRAVQTVKKNLDRTALFNQKGEEITENLILDKLTSFLFTYRNPPSTVTGLFPAVTILKSRPRTGFDLLKPDIYQTCKSTGLSTNSSKLYNVNELVYVEMLRPDCGIKEKL
ncbi:hypothetical protein ILUMI_19156 [Ignelater luminosus]|uniref:Integrase catalytic domain-containing protein n=1 Tax=Ignelater luminosus TaxID=2038154 RepID=A0A8K0CJV5_IGNLU|nr:hypothetical protein ILUMI_19156 [Ignelater luminosus]